MRDQRLTDLNFRELLDYGGQPSPAFRYKKPRPHCSGYCVSCEKDGLVHKNGGRLDLMSHGCDSADFEAILGTMPKSGPVVTEPILFLLENPGKDYDNGKKVKFDGFEKEPPVKHYYFSPSTDVWPNKLDEFKENFYGPYFAYLMRKHQLTNVYITNLVKCKYHDSQDETVNTPSDIYKNCVDLWLRREIRYFDPKLVVCFGERAEGGFKFAYSEKSFIKSVCLYHPSYICDRWQTARKRVGETDKEKVQNALIDINDNRLRGAIGPPS
jgi:Uracil DNA glycosylase superfamily